MPDKKHKKDDRARSDHAAEHHGPRPFWSGTITFGLISLPVSLFLATRSKRVALRMIDHDGEPLARRYFCPKEEIALEADDIVRGYEVEKDQFVIVGDEELDAVAPEKTQEIDLRRFVDVDAIDPMFFQRAYFLAPDQGATKPYRLLAKSMEDAHRAGIATCVIRGKEYLLAILAHRGILRAEILRFADELRSPADIGLPEVGRANKADIERVEQSINAHSRKTLDHDELLDERAARILNLVDKKLKADEDVIHTPEDQDEEQDDEPADLMAVLKHKMQQDDESGHGESDQTKRKAKSRRKKRSSASQKKRTGGKNKKAADDTSAQATRDELYAQAQTLEIRGRSRMTKDELAAAIDAAQ